jgi:hypothetical protein
MIFSIRYLVQLQDSYSLKETKNLHNVMIEELPQQWKESIIIPIYKKGDKD